MSGSKAYIRIDKVSKHFGPVVAVDEVDISIRGGEFFSLLGASGQRIRSIDEPHA